MIQSRQSRTNEAGGFPTRELLSTIVAVVILAIISLLSYRAWEQFNRHTGELQTTQQIVKTTDSLLSSLKDVETGQRGFIFTGKVEYLDHYNTAILKIPGLLQSLRTETTAYPDEAQLVQKLPPLITEKLLELQQTIQLRRNQGLKRALALVDSDRGKSLMDRIGKICSKISLVTETRLALSAKQSLGSAQTLALTATLGALVLTLFLLASTVTVKRGIARRNQLLEDLHRSELQIEESRHWLDITLRIIGDGVIATDDSGRVIFLNEIAQALTGWTTDLAAGLPIEQIFVIHNENTGQPAHNPATRALQEGRVVALANHTVLTTKNGGKLHIDDTAGPIRGSDGAIKGAVLVFRDVSDRKLAEAEIQANADRLQLLFDANPIGVINGDIHGAVRYANDAFLAITGYSKEDFATGVIDWKKLTPPELLPLDYRAIAEASEKGSCSPYEKEYIRKDGSRIPVYIGFALIGESREESIAFILDLTDRKRAEAALTYQLRRLVDSNIVGVVVVSETKVLDANDLYLSMLGHSRQDLIEGRVDWVRSTPPEYFERDREALDQIRKSGVCTSFEKEYVRRDGTRVPVLLGAAAVTYQPELTCVCFVVDLTSQKALARQLQSSNQLLSKANEELEQFAYVVAHDLQSPLRTISSMTTLLAQQLEPELDAYNKQLFTFVQTSAKHMSSLITDLLEYSKVAGDATPLKPVQTNSLLQQALINLNSQISETEAIIICDPLPPVEADTQLVRIFQNLINNSLKYRSERTPRIHVTSCLAGAEWIFSVQDNGLGFEQHHAEKIFGVFQRLHDQGKYEGTGIGLAICKKLIEQYGGRIWAESQPNVGSTFFFSLPVAVGAASHEPEIGKAPAV